MEFAQLLRGTKGLLRRAIRGSTSFRPDHQCAVERLGTEYGGYVVAKGTLDTNSVVYSFGIGDDISFDVAIMKQYGVEVHGFDPTPKSIAWVKARHLPDRFVFHGYGISDSDGTMLFYPPENPQHISYSIVQESRSRQSIEVPMKRLSTIMRELGHDRIDLLKLDIEGAEFGVIRDMSKSAIRPKQILIEFHHRFKGVGRKRLKEAVRQLREMGYRLFSVSESDEDYSFVHSSILR